MRKIPSLFKRNYDGDRLVRNEVVEGAEWVILGEGVATRKWDGTACMVRDGKLYKRYDAKQGKKPPVNWEAAQDVPDAITGHWPGWLPVGEGAEDKYHREAFNGAFEDGTYELCGPKVQGGAEGFVTHLLIKHGDPMLPNCPRDFEGIKDYLGKMEIEGIVWHHPDGRMVKVKRRDFGLRWPK